MAGEIQGFWPSVVSGLSALGISFGFLHKNTENLKKEIDNKVEKDMCEVLHTELKEDIQEIKENNNTVVKVQTQMSETLLLVGERLDSRNKHFDKLESKLDDWMLANGKSKEE